MDTFLSSDGVRLLILPILLWAAWNDIQTRRVPNKTWLPVLGIGLLAFGIDIYNLLIGNVMQPRLFIYTSLLTIGITVPFAFFVYVVGGFGGADVKALILFAVVFPITPIFIVGESTYPIVTPTHGIFPLTIFGNALLIAILLLPLFVLLNLTKKNISPVMFLGIPRKTNTLSERYGNLLENTDGFTRRGVDLDILNGYREWVQKQNVDGTDPENATAYLQTLEHTYGTTHDVLSDGFELVEEQHTVWVSPGTPFFVPLCIGLVVGLTYGDVLIALLTLIGLA